MRPVPVGVAPPNATWRENTYGEAQPQYFPLPTLETAAPEGDVISRWRPTWRERLAVLCGADVFLTVLTFGRECGSCGYHQGLQPQKVTIGSPWKGLPPCAR